MRQDFIPDLFPRIAHVGSLNKKGATEPIIISYMMTPSAK